MEGNAKDGFGGRDGTGSLSVTSSDFISYYPLRCYIYFPEVLANHF